MAWFSLGLLHHYCKITIKLRRRQTKYSKTQKLQYHPKMQLLICYQVSGGFMKVYKKICMSAQQDIQFYTSPPSVVAASWSIAMQH